MNTISPSSKALDLARQVLRIEGDAVLALIDRVDDAFLEALSLILNCRGRVIVSGIGKSGHIARKIASTLASTGTPAYFVHPAEASHGDLGMITCDDVLIAFSNSGESDELLNILPSIKRQGAKLIALTGNPQSSLARDADAHLNAGVPVLASVEAILRAIWPDFPMPLTMTRPRQLRISDSASRNALSTRSIKASTASPSMRSTWRARSRALDEGAMVFMGRRRLGSCQYSRSPR